MATNSDAEKLRKQIEVLSSLISTHREIKKNDSSTNKQQSSVKYNWKKESSENKKESESSSRNELSDEGQYKNNSFPLDRRKDGNSVEFRAKTSASNPLPRTGTTKTYKNNNSYQKSEQIIPLLRPSVSRDTHISKSFLVSVDKDNKCSKILDRNDDKTREGIVSEMWLHETSKKGVNSLSASRSLLSARLSSLSSSIAAAKSKLNLESSAVSNTGSEKLTKFPSTTSYSSSNVLMKSSSSSLKTQDKINWSSSSSSFSWSKLQTSVPRTSSLFNMNKPSTSSSSSHILMNSLPSSLNNKGKINQSSSSSYSWSKLGTSVLRTSSLSNMNKPSTSSLKWTKPIRTNKNRSTLGNKPLHATRVSVKPSHGNTLVWRSQQSLKLDRRKRRSITSESKGFMRRRQKALKDVPRKAVHVSRYSLVNCKRKNPIKAEKSNKVVIIEGVQYKSSANKLQKASQEKTGRNPKKAKRRPSMTLNIRGEKFLMSESGKTLTRINPGKTPIRKGPERDTPREAASISEGTKGKHAKSRSSLSKVSIGGVTFVQTAPGVLVRSNDAVNKKIASRVVRRSVQHAILYKYKKNVKTKSKSEQYCMFYNRFGKCNKGVNCPYIHDPTKIAVCTKFLQGKCKKTDGTCSFSHKIDKDKMPVCQFFLKGTCTNDDCPYSHVNVNSKAAVCQDFIRGYCVNGQQCKMKHILDCEEFSRTGKCSKGKKCNLIHRERKAKKRSRQSSTSKEPKPKQAALEQLTEEDGFLPLVQIDVSTEKDSSHPDDVTHKQPESIAIKPRFLVNKDKPG
ncbi:zinc finger CCCH domain-containing protein 3-like isoform X2 [Actinia tenebrosa]|uniref:Zinc finger CCCH domain-containing protein 3 n=1 Tax=Actinia tenebrosa TaxID=6105 RepID=A0A6P8HNW3_ACTTE|nr:zinc finger CCCH domain-containing protein 3-like isoform X2 [Actinia tenebrosa]